MGFYPGVQADNVARVAAALPAAGAWDGTPLVIACAGARTALLAFDYTRGGAAGAFDYQIQVSPFSFDPLTGVIWFPAAVYAAGAVAAGTDVASLVQRDVVTYTATGVAAEGFPVLVEIGAAERIRVVCRESGNVGAPGTLRVRCVLGE